jgi:hypothetical protein
MSKEKTQSIISNLKETYSGSPWYGTCVKDILEKIPHEVVHSPLLRRGVGGEVSDKNVLPDVHSIYQLVTHMLAWKVFTMRKLRGEKEYSITLNSEADWAINKEISADEWKQMLMTMDEAHNQIISILEEKDDDFLSEKVPVKSNSVFNYEYLLNGIIHHDIYHLGQIALVKKVVMK